MGRKKEGRKRRRMRYGWRRKESRRRKRVRKFRILLIFSATISRTSIGMVCFC